MWVLDTDHLSLWLRGSGNDAVRLRSRVKAVPAGKCVTTVITYEEQCRGWLAYISQAKSMVQTVEAYRRLGKHLRDFGQIGVLDFDDRATVELRRLRSLKIRIGTMDLRIAAIAISRNSTLLTRNLSDFRKVPDLKVEDWTV